MVTLILLTQFVLQLREISNFFWCVIIDINYKSTQDLPKKHLTHLFEESMGQKRWCWRSMKDKQFIFKVFKL